VNLQRTQAPALHTSLEQTPTKNGFVSIVRLVLRLFARASAGQFASVGTESQPTFQVAS
jgi:hypothetical protein